MRTNFLFGLHAEVSVGVKKWSLTGVGQNSKIVQEISNIIEKGKNDKIK